MKKRARSPGAETFSAATATLAEHCQIIGGFARLSVVPGMNHCSGWPATDQPDTLTPLVDWVEKGVAPDSIVATASNPGYFGVASRTRPLCPYPKQTRYKGSGDINLASNFTCQ